MEASNTEKFLEDIESIPGLSEATGENLQPKLAEIANKRWGLKMAPDKLKELLSKHLTLANCTEMIIPGVNPEIWAQMNQTYNIAKSECCHPSIRRLNLINAIWPTRLCQERTSYTYH